MDKIVYDQGAASRALMPANFDGTPNYNLLRQFDEAQEEVKQHPEWNPQEINQFYASRALPFVKVDNGGNIIPGRYLKPFLVFHAWATDQVGATDNNNNIHELNRGERKKVQKMLEPFFEKNGIKNPVDFWGSDQYKGIVAYPILEDASANVAAMEGNLYAPKTGISDVK